MSTFGKLIIALLLVFSLTSCQLFHRASVKQGNELPPASVQKIHAGMSKEQVEQILGTPILTNVYNDNTLTYVYTIKPGYSRMQKSYLIIYFRGNQVSSYTTNVRYPTTNG